VPSKLALHLISTHRDGYDLEIWRRWQPPVAKLFRSEWSDQNLVGWFMASLPGTTFQFRDWDMDRDQDSTYAKNPEAAGREHADSFHHNLSTYGYLQWKDRIVVCGINEPRVWTHLDWVVRYYAAFVRRCTELGMRAGALCLSVGWPNNTGPDTPVNWAPFAPVLQAIQEGRARGIGHVLVLHEYWDIAGPKQNWRWWAGRYLQCPWQVPIIIGECGVDRGVISGDYARPEKQQERGFHKWLSPEQYLAQLTEYDREIRKDARILGACVYTYDYGSNEWASFDIRPMRDRVVRYVEEQRGVPDVPAPPPPPKEDKVDHPGAIWLPSPNLQSRPAGVRIDTVVIHSTAGPLQPSLDWLRNPASKASSHYVIAKDGRVFQLVREAAVAWHAGYSRMPDGREDVNMFSLGIELENANDGRDPYPAAQVAALVAVLKGIVARHRIVREKAVSHELIRRLFKQAHPERTDVPAKTDPRGLDLVGVLNQVYGAPTPAREPLPEDESLAHVGVVLEKATWWAEEMVRQNQARRYDRAWAIQQSLARYLARARDKFAT
jgi:hypothetical protein